MPRFSRSGEGADMADNETMTEGQQRYADYWAKQMAEPEFRAVYEEEAAKKELWLQLVEARQAAGLTQAALAERLGVSQAQVARIEKRGYDAYTLTTLRRYVQALGQEYSLVVQVRHTPPPKRARASRAAAAR
jgi:DNA-binding XRE family transcriptional regulator